MKTGLSFENFEPKRILGYESFGARLLDYLKDSVKSFNQTIYDLDIVIGAGIALDSSGANKFKFKGSGVCMDGVGHMLLPFESAVWENVDFENTNTISYYVALHHTEYPVGITVNPVTGYPQWNYWTEEIGLEADPTSVVDNGNGTITMVVDSVLEANCDHSGRVVKVWKNSLEKNANTEAIAIEECTVTYSGGNNKITTTAAFGQSTVSTTVSDYSVSLIGPSVSRYTDLRAEDEYTFIGIITGNGGTPTAFDTSDQKVMSYTWVTALLDGLPQDLYPATDNTYDLGKPTHTWANIYTTNLSVAGDFLPVTDDNADLGSASYRWQDLFLSGTATLHNVVPETNDTYDLGTWTHQWQDLYINGIANIDTLSMSVTAGEGVATDLVPTANNLKDLGNASYNWKSAYFSGTVNIGRLDVSSGGGSGVISDFAPSSDNSVDLGTATEEWKDLYLDGVAYIDTLSLSVTAGEGVDTDLVPTSDNAKDLGNSGYEWRDLYLDGTAYIDTLTLSEANDEGVGSHLIPNSDNSRDLGSSIYQWKDLYINGVAYIDTIEVQGTGILGGVGSNLNPNADSSYDLGTSAYRYADVFADDIYEGNEPYLWARISTPVDVSGDSTWQSVLPEDNILASGLTVEDTSRVLEATGTTNKGYYKVDCVFVVDPALTSMTLQIAVFRDTGGGFNRITNSTQSFQLRGDAAAQQLTYTFLAELTGSNDKIELRCYHTAGALNLIRFDTNSLITVVRCKHTP